MFSNVSVLYSVFIDWVPDVGMPFANVRKRAKLCRACYVKPSMHRHHRLGGISSAVFVQSTLLLRFLLPFDSLHNSQLRLGYAVKSYFCHVCIKLVTVRSEILNPTWGSSWTVESVLSSLDCSFFLLLVIKLWSVRFWVVLILKTQLAAWCECQGRRTASH